MMRGTAFEIGQVRKVSEIDLKKDRENRDQEKESGSCSGALDRFDALQAEFYRTGFVQVVMRRLLQDWLSTREGKAAVRTATTALNMAYRTKGYSPCQDFITESRELLRRVKKGEPKQSVSEISFKMDQVREVCQQAFMPTLPPDGYFELLHAHEGANAELHKNFTRQELQDLQETAGSISTPAASLWLRQLSADVERTL